MAEAGRHICIMFGWCANCTHTWREQVLAVLHYYYFIIKNILYITFNKKVCTVVYIFCYINEINTYKIKAVILCTLIWEQDSPNTMGFISQEILIGLHSWVPIVAFWQCKVLCSGRKATLLLQMARDMAAGPAEASGGFESASKLAVGADHVLWGGNRAWWERNQGNVLGNGGVNPAALVNTNSYLSFFCPPKPPLFSNLSKQNKLIYVRGDP